MCVQSGTRSGPEVSSRVGVGTLAGVNLFLKRDDSNGEQPLLRAHAARKHMPGSGWTAKEVECIWFCNWMQQAFRSGKRAPLAHQSTTAPEHPSFKSMRMRL
eukprot:3557519-Rhodomonas_salina.1